VQPDTAGGRPGQGGGPQNTTSAATTVAQRRLPTAYASVFVPQGNRAWYWLTFRCPVCDTYVFARSRHLDEVSRPRRATCGHRVATVAARIYGRLDGEAA
jgi:hypothetical protein